MEIVIISGLSGSGKSQAANALEDLGYYCIDNMPPKLINNFMDIAAEENTELEKAAFVIDARGGALLDDVKNALADLHDKEIPHKIVFLEASDQVLIRRYSETRRNHPLASSGSTTEGIKKERERLKDLRDKADITLDTSNMKPADLYREIKEMFSVGKSEENFIVNILSFGYKHGLPLGADIIIDVRFIPNPYYIPELKKLNGRDKPVSDYVLKQKASREFISKMKDMIVDLIPFYVNEGKYHLNIAFGCTGGQHRSVAIAEEMARIFKEAGKNVILNHRDVDQNK
ncbi:MAG: RNase adapter RapZ [Bacillota bacterium]|nr:RNase adapter RapZ [Bacillota bacterium]